MIHAIRHNIIILKIKIKKYTPFTNAYQALKVINSVFKHSIFNPGLMIIKMAEMNKKCMHSLQFCNR